MEKNWLGLLLVKAILSFISKPCESQDHFKLHLQALEKQFSSYFEQLPESFFEGLFSKLNYLQGRTISHCHAAWFNNFF